MSELYAELGRVLRERFRGWQAAILSGNPASRAISACMRSARIGYSTATWNAGLLRFDLGEPREPRTPEAARAERSQRPGAQMFANRLRKNLARLDPWAAREHIECFRLYDADMPEYAFAIDLYGREPRHVCLQEYAAPKSVDIRARASAAATCWRRCRRSLQVPLERMHSRVRKPQKGAEQYEKRELDGGPGAVREGGLEFWVNFGDYLDTGLFLDHRIVRGMLREWARDADFFNLFCYTGSATVYAAAGGARSSVSVDLSNTYLDWAHENLALNGFAGRAARAAAEPIAASGWTSESPRGPRFDLDLCRSADFLELQAHAGRARRAAGPRRHDSPGHAAAARRPAGWCSRPTTAASSSTRLRSRNWRSRTSAPAPSRRTSSAMRASTAVSYLRHRGAAP